MIVIAETTATWLALTLGAISFVGGMLMALVNWRNGGLTARIAQQSVAVNRDTELDAKQRSIAEMGFKAADEANTRAERIAKEAAEQVAALEAKVLRLEAVVGAQGVRIQEREEAHAAELGRLRATHAAELHARDAEIVRLQAEVGRLSLRVRELERRGEPVE